VADSHEGQITAAATAVMKALEPLAGDDRARVLHAAAALHCIALGKPESRAPSLGFTTLGEEHDLPPAGHKPLSLVELLRVKDPATNSQRIATFAYYRERHEGKDRFSRSDLEHYFALAKLPKPGNYDRDFTGAVREGWIHEDGAASYLTQGGERAVDGGFGGKGKARGASVSKTKKRTPEEEV
jgi:hypothetical protein